MPSKQKTPPDQTEIDDNLDTPETENQDIDNKTDIDDEGEEGQSEQDGDNQDETESDDDSAGEDEQETIITIGDEQLADKSGKQAAPEWVRELRKNYRDIQRENRELRARLESQQGTQQAPKIELGPKPKLTDYDYDDNKYEQALSDWYETKRKADDQVSQQKQAAEAQTQQWQERLNTYESAKTALKVSDFEDAESIVTDLMDQTQQGVILHGAEKPEILVYALGKNPGKAKELAKIKDPVKFAFAIAKLEAQLKVTTRKPSTQPEGRVNGSGNISGTVNNRLDALRKEAEKTGDYTKVTAYKRELRRKQREMR